MPERSARFDPDSEAILRLRDARVSRRTLLRGAVLGGAFVAMPGFLAACSDSPAPSTKDIDTLTWGTTSIRALDYAHSFDAQTGVPVAIALESLLTFDSDLKLTPLLAESWSQPDPLSYVFKLRPDVTFWDGSKLTAEDVVFSLERHRDPEVASEMAYTFDSVESIEASGSNEVTVRLKTPDPFFAYVQTFTSITPKAFSEGQGDQLGRPGGQVTTMGTGPYKITAFRADDSVTLERNEDYHGQAGPAKRINIKLFADPQTMQLAMRSGEIDGTFQVPLAQFNQWDDISGARTISAAGLNVSSLFFNMTRKPWDDINVRRAVAYCIDREGLVRGLLGGRAQVANSIVPPAQWGALLPEEQIDSLYAELPQFSLDIDKAKEAIAVSSVPAGFTTTIQYPNILAEVGKALLSLQENLRKINVELDVKEVPPPQWFGDLDAEKHDVGVIGLAPDYPDPANYILSAYAGGPGNRAHFENPDVTRLIAEQQEATDPAVRAEAIAQILRTVEPEIPYLHLWWPDAVMAVSEKFDFTGFTPLWYNQIWTESIAAA